MTLTTDDNTAQRRQIEEDARQTFTAIVDGMIKARKAQGISQRKLGELAGVKQSVIARIETGKTTPTLETMIKILVPLGKALIMADFTPEQTSTMEQNTALVLESSERHNQQT